MITGQRSAASISIPGWVTSRGSAWRLETDHYANLDVCAADPETMTIEVWESTMACTSSTAPSRSRHGQRCSTG